MSTEQLFASVAAGLLAEGPGIQQGRMLHQHGLKTDEKFFAFTRGDDLFLKLPAERVQGLIGSGEGQPCVLGRGSPMREWVRVVPRDEEACAAYMAEARAFVAALPQTHRRVRTSRARRGSRTGQPSATSPVDAPPTNR